MLLRCIRYHWMYQRLAQLDGSEAFPCTQMSPLAYPFITSWTSGLLPGFWLLWIISQTLNLGMVFSTAHHTGDLASLSLKYMEVEKWKWLASMDWSLAMLELPRTATGKVMPSSLWPIPGSVADVHRWEIIHSSNKCFLSPLYVSLPSGTWKCLCELVFAVLDITI